MTLVHTEEDHVKEGGRPLVALRQGMTQNPLLLFQPVLSHYFKLGRKQKTIKCLTFYDLVAYFVNLIRSCLEQLNSILCRSDIKILKNDSTC